MHAYRRFPLLDPELPDDLSPPGWPGQQAHTTSWRRTPALAHYRAVVADYG